MRDNFAGPRLRTALLAGYHDLSELRYDFPLVLAADDAGGILLRPLSEIVDGILQAIAKRGPEGERPRREVLALEREIRALVLGGAAGRLSQLWQTAEQNLLARAEPAARAALGDSFARARGARALDGEIIDCDERTPSRVVTHLWNAVQAAKARVFRERIERLILRLSEILRADFMKSGEARAPERLAHAFGGAFESAFDFEALARILAAAPRGAPLPENRRQRIQSALNVLRTQKFVPCAGGIEPYGFAFDGCAQALEAFRQRLPEMVAVVKAMAVAELELENRYREPVHDPFFARFDENALKPDELARFPSCLVRVRDRGDGAGMAEIAEALASGLPLKILLQCDDILSERTVASGKFAFGRQGAQLAGVAVGLNDVFVVQACSSHLYAMQDRFLGGLRHEGPSLFSIFSGCSAGAADLPPYLMAAAALESRAFPAFTYDPAAGADLAARFDVAGNPQAQAAWPVHRLDYEDEEHQSISENLAFTFADFVACDRRYTARFARVPRSRWQDGLVPVADFLQNVRTAGGMPAGQVPYTPLIDESDVLQRCVPDDALILAAGRCLEAWHGLQELAGGTKPQVARAPEQVPAPTPQTPATPPPAEAAPSAAAPQEAAKETAAVADVAYIETPRCTTCEECIQVNNRMFAYDENKQAYITDPAAGTYRDLVEAAERCQVSIIHPGKPTNPAEPGLEELIERAAPFQ